MKTLVLVRHAKSSWGDPGLDDHERPLNDRGRRNAPEMGRRLAARDIRPDLIVSSTAVRARTTAELIADEIGFGADRVETDERLYAATPDEVLEVIRGLDDDASTVFIVGHNPETASLARRFSDEITEMPTSAVAEFRFDVDSWAKIGDAEPVDVRVDTPR
jgi:phosphohistidine phosphatase